MPGECPPQAGRSGIGGKRDSGIAAAIAVHPFPRPKTSPKSSLRANVGCILRRPLAGWPVALLWLLSLGGGRSVAEEALPGLMGVMPVTTLNVIQLSVFAGIMGSAMMSAIWLIRERARIAAENTALRARVSDLNASLQRGEALLNLRDQRILVWARDNARPELIGGLPAQSGAPDDRSAFFAFGRWLTPHSAAQLERLIAALRESGERFDVVVETQQGSLLEVNGRKPGAHVVVRFMSLSDARKAHARFKLEHQRLLAEHALFVGLAEALPMPQWLRGADGKLKWVNKAYAEAVEAPDPETAVAEGREFLGTQVREAMQKVHASEAVYAQTVSTVVGGDRRRFAVTGFANPEGSAGIATDRSEIEAVREEFERTLRNHSDTLDQLNTAVAIFGADEKLRFFNQAFQKLWDLDPAFLHSAPENALVLDRLRAEGKLAEQPEWRRWKEQLLAAYRAVDPHEHWWHLPDGRTLRVVANPQPKGGVTWVFENLTERIDLESRYNAAIRVQGETLDNLAEGVAVFGSDGRIRLANPSFSRLWRLPQGFVGEKTHIAGIREACDRQAKDSPWAMFVAAATGFDDERRDRQGQTELLDGTVLRFAVIHLPNGQVMMTFVDVTDTVNVERALKEKNEALQKADQLKNDFVQHVNYELRSPLTNIIGFTELLAQGSTGSLNDRQRDYVDHISSSSSVLLTIVNDILDLATVDAGIMELDIAEVPVRQTVEAAASLVSERLREHAILLSLDTAQAPASFHADGNRVRQILFNLLANAANYAPEGSVIKLSCRQDGEWVTFSVHDDGPGMPPEVLSAVFRRFEPQANGGRRRGAGLGLSIVKGFVELHHGEVEIDTGAGGGTTVTVRFPLSQEGFRVAAE